MLQNKNNDPTSNFERTAAVLALAGSLTVGAALAQPNDHDIPTSEATAVSTPQHDNLINAPKPPELTVSPTATSQHNGLTITLNTSNKKPTPAAANTLYGETKKINLHPENWVVSPIAKKIMNKNVTYMDGCSGFLIRNPVTNFPIAALTATHCLGGTGVDDKNIIKGGDNKNYVMSLSKRTSATGSHLKKLNKPYKITQYIVAEAADTTHDEALAVFDGHSSQEVYNAFHANKLTTVQINNLKINDEIDLAGWPVYQPNNEGALERQEFRLGYIGRETVTTAGGKTLNVVWAAAAKNQEGTTCSPGDSGGAGFVIINGKPVLIGPLGAYYDLTSKISNSPEQAEQIKQYYSNKFGVDLKPMAGLCAFAIDSPDPRHGAQTIIPVQNKSQIPGFSELHSAESQIARARKAFFDPKAERTIINGVIGISDGQGKGGEYKWYTDPVAYYDKQTGSLVLGAYSKDQPDHLETTYIPSIDLITAYSNGVGEAAISESVGAVTSMPDTDPSSGHFADEHGVSIAGLLPAGQQPDFGTGFSLQYNQYQDALYLINRGKQPTTK